MKSAIFVFTILLHLINALGNKKKLKKRTTEGIQVSFGKIKFLTTKRIQTNFVSRALRRMS